MRLRQLETFITVCELGSISRAAERLHVAQPALGLQIRGLEDDMGMLLLERHSRGVQPTPAGRLVLQWATDVVEGTRRIKAQLRSLRPEPAVSIGLGLTPSIATAFALPILTAVQAQHPEIRLRLTEALGSVLEEWMAAGKVDLALVFDPVQGEPADAHPAVLTERLYFVEANEDGARKQGPIELAEVLEHPLALALEGDGVRTTLERAAHGIGAVPRVAYEAQSTAVMLKLVESGLATTVLPLSLALERVRAGRLAARPIASPALQRRLGWRQGAPGREADAQAQVRRIVEQVLRTAADDPVLGQAYRFDGTGVTQPDAGR